MHAKKEIDEDNITFLLTAAYMHHIRGLNLDDRFMHKGSEFEKHIRILRNDPNSMQSCLGKIAVKKDQAHLKLQAQQH